MVKHEQYSAMVHRLIFNIGPQVYGMQYNHNYSLRDGTLEAIPYVANNEASLNQNFTDAEQIQWLTFNARNIDDKLDLEVSAPMLNRFYKAYSQLGKNIKEDSKLTPLLDFIIDYGNRFEDQDHDYF